MIEITTFISQFVDQFDNDLPETICENTRFRGLDGWSSYTALSVMAMVDEEYDVQLTASEMRKAETISELFELVKSHI